VPSGAETGICRREAPELKPRLFQSGPRLWCLAQHFLQQGAVIKTAAEVVKMPDILFILLLALVIFGPKKLPEITGLIGKRLANFRRL